MTDEPVLSLAIAALGAVVAEKADLTADTPGISWVGSNGDVNTLLRVGERFVHARVVGASASATSYPGPVATVEAADVTRASGDGGSGGGDDVARDPRWRCRHHAHRWGRGEGRGFGGLRPHPDSLSTYTGTCPVTPSAPAGPWPDGAVTAVHRRPRLTHPAPCRPRHDPRRAARPRLAHCFVHHRVEVELLTSWSGRQHLNCVDWYPRRANGPELGGLGHSWGHAVAQRCLEQHDACSAEARYEGSCL